MKELNESIYNASVQNIRRLHDTLMIVRICPDLVPPPFNAGQYATLGLGSWEPRIDSPRWPQTYAPFAPRRLVQRAYSVSCPVLNEHQELVTCGQLGFLEFYIAKVTHPTDDPPRLTPRLFALNVGSRVYVAPRFHGTYTLAPCSERDSLVFLATGTGEAPHNAMIAELLSRGHRGAIVSAVCVRHRCDLGYLDVHRELERRFDNYHYVALTTRDPENLDPSHPGYIGKQYLQDYVQAGQLEMDTGVKLDASNTHVYLCGNPSMIGLPQHVEGIQEPSPQHGSMVEVLTRRGFRLHQPHTSGNIHVERYW